MDTVRADMTVHSQKSVRYFVYLVCVVLCNSTAQLMMKAAALYGIRDSAAGWLAFFNVWYLCALGALGLGFLFWQRVLVALPLSFAHPFCSLIYLVVPAMSCLLYGDRVNGAYVVGLVMLLAGICLTAHGATKKYDELTP